MKNGIGLGPFFIRRGSGAAGGGGGGYSPADAPGVVHWYDVSDAASRTDDGTNISVLSDKVGSANLGNGTTSAHPALGTINGLSAASFNSDVLFSDAANTAFQVEDQPFTVAIASRRTSATAERSIASISSSSAGGLIAFRQTVDQFKLLKSDATGASASFIGGAWVLNDVDVIIYKSDGTTGEILVNGVSVGTGALNVGAATSVNRITLGASYAFGFSTYFAGEVGEMVVCSANLTGGDLTSLQSYLTAKWLPA